MELSKKKSVFTANSDKLGKELEETWQHLGITYRRYVKSLGVGMAAGRRNVKELFKRLKNFKERVPRFRKLIKLGVDPAMVVRTGGKSSIVYGESTMGVSNSLLQSQRRSVAAAVAPQFGTGGQNLDIALMMADASAKGSADPAFDAHILVIGDWARGVWNEWMPRASLNGWVARAKLKLVNAKRVWAKVNGPATAFVATCSRLLWIIVDGTKLKTDEGVELDLTLDPPAAVIRHVRNSVVRWRWRNTEAKFPDLAANGSGRGAMMQPIWSLLKDQRNDDQWDSNCRGGLRSTLAGRQFTQNRCYAAGWSDHDRCLACLYRIVNPPDAQCGVCAADIVAEFACVECHLISCRKCTKYSKCLGCNNRYCENCTSGHAAKCRN